MPLKSAEEVKASESAVSELSKNPNEKDAVITKEPKEENTGSVYKSVSIVLLYLSSNLSFTTEKAVTGYLL